MWYQFGPPTTSRSFQTGVLTESQILARRIAAKLLQLAAWLLLTAYRNLPTPYPTVPSSTPYGHLFFQNRGPYTQNLHGALRPNCVIGMVTINRLYTFTNALSDAYIADLPLSHQTGVYIDPSPKYVGC